MILPYPTGVEREENRIERSDLTLLYILPTAYRCSRNGSNDDKRDIQDIP